MKTCFFSSLKFLCLSFLLFSVAGCSKKSGAGGEQDAGVLEDGEIVDVVEIPDFGLIDSEPTDAEICAQSSVEATLEVKPIDIIIFIDNSGSMSHEIQEVERQINKNFAEIIDAAEPAIDYRVIMLSQFGSYGSNDICVAEPLGGIPDTNDDGHCDTIPSQPLNTGSFYHHSARISSHNGLCQVITYLTTADQYNLQPNGYGEILRPEAFKFLLVVTDDGVRCGDYHDYDTVAAGWDTAYAFDEDLMTLFPEHFGHSPEERNYTFWSIVSLAPYEPTVDKPYGEPHPPDENLAPVIEDECTPSAVDPGTGYQALSIITGGYRYPTCGLEYTEIFQLMAEGVISGAAVACEFLIPDPPEGETLDLDTVQVPYGSDGEEIEVFNKVDSIDDCSEDEYNFYFDENHIVLCPNTCDLVQSDPNAEIGILFGCELNVVVN